ncbi:hypothetical protein ACA545_01260, partial [Vibrio cholerae]|uniref:hypothetical protein n=1 Tax=Vibrio cholerae TaxID=666 RepID=UPI003A101160
MEHCGYVTLSDSISVTKKIRGSTTLPSLKTPVVTTPALFHTLSVPSNLKFFDKVSGIKPE